MTEHQMEMLRKIQHLLDEAYAHYFANSDGHCKTSEGEISVSFGNYWDRLTYGVSNQDLEVNGVDIYSYALPSPSRNHHFDTLEQALQEVQKWHDEEMTTNWKLWEGLC